MRRWHEDKKVMHRNRRKLRWMETYGVVLPSKTFKSQLGRFRKKDAFDCGNAGCVSCHCDKILGVPTRQERKAALAFKEQLP